VMKTLNLRPGTVLQLFMRRWWRLWLGTALVLVALIAVVVLALPPKEPFAFLRDHTAIELKERTIQARVGGPTKVYSFEADYDQLLKEARRELESLGYSETLLVTGEHVFGLSVPGPPGRFMGERQVSSVKLLRNVHLTAANIDDSNLPRWKEGWVAVVFHHNEQPTWWQTFCSRLGL
jgi:hypothetical protein